jgi:DNA-binding MarR family transcriptional regulator
MVSDPLWPDAATPGEVSLTAQQVIQALRQITRAIDLDSRSLWHQFGLTAPQLAALLAISREQPLTAGGLAKRLHLGQPTVTGILDRLERRAYVQRVRGERDRRSVLLRLTPAGEQVLLRAPSLLQGFCQHWATLEASAQTQILSSLQQVAAMMERSAQSCLPPVVVALNEPAQ